MRSFEISSIAPFNWDNPQEASHMQRAIEARLNRTINLYENGEHLGKESWFYRTNLAKLGIQYRVEGDPKDIGSRIILTDISGFISRQKKMRELVELGETNMAKVYANVPFNSPL